MQVQSVNFNTITPKYFSVPKTLPRKVNNVGVSENPLKKYDAIPFLGISPGFLKAKAYLDSVKPAKGFDKLSTDIYKFDLNKLDGIQDGIKVFDGLNIKELAFISRTVLSINTVRGCHNMCSHCYANALPPMKEAGEFINKMSWEDFKSLTAGYRELADRLGFHISASKIDKSERIRYMAPFHDSDCMDLVMKDKEGKEHFADEIIKELSDSTGIKGLFDTTGWAVSNKKLQQLAERYVEFYSKPENFKNMKHINISINPFHALHTRSVMERRAGNIEQAEKFREIYTERIANAIYTFTPILKTGKLDFIIRGFDAERIGEVGKGFTVKDLDALITEILGKVKQKYIQDFAGERKYIKSEDKIKSNIREIKKLMKNQLSDAVSLFDEERSLKTFGNSNKYYLSTKETIAENNKTIKAARGIKELSEEDLNGIIDSNGKYYITTYYSTYPTELQFNFINKNMKTAPIKPALQEDIVISKAVINNV